MATAAVFVASGEPLQVFLEYFDMDAATRDSHGIQLFQFKVSSQAEPTSFTLSEVEDILRNASHAILKHQQHSTESITGFVVASNRPIGQYFDALQSAGRNRAADVNRPDSLADFADTLAPVKLFAQSKQTKSTKKKGVNTRKRKSTEQNSPAKTMRNLAQKIIGKKAGEWGFSSDSCVDACLKAIATFGYALARPERLREALHEWFRSWGILADEYETYTNRILGVLQSQALHGTEADKFLIMRRVFDSPNAVPIVPKQVWLAVINDLVRQWSDPPTKHLITGNGAANWMYPRSHLLRGLPYSFAEDTSIGQRRSQEQYLNANTSPRIFVLVGPGGTGKTGLLAQLFAAIGGGVWDWQAHKVRDDMKFIGYPIIFEAEETALREVDAVIRKWGGRDVALDRPVERLAAANGLNTNEVALWIGFDGIDEVPDEYLIQVAKVMANFADAHPRVRLVLTSRPEQLDLIATRLNGKGLMRMLRVDEFDPDQAREAVLQATNRELRLGKRTSEVLAAGQISDNTPFSGPDRHEFEESIRQPLFIGVIRRVYEQHDGIRLIQAACDQDPDAMLKLATEYVHVFCERLHKRLNRPYATVHKIFDALRRLAADVENPSGATRSDWIRVCEVSLSNHVRWEVLNTQCISSGLIHDLGFGAFEWRHPSVGRYLPVMEADPTWG